MLVFGVAISIASSVSGYFLALALNASIGGMMALMTGAFLILALACGPRHGLVVRRARRRRQMRDNETRMLAVHLFNHENTAREKDENVVEALHTHLGWPAARVDAVMARSLETGQIVREGRLLRLTPKGRSAARQIPRTMAAGCPRRRLKSFSIGQRERAGAGIKISQAGDQREYSFR